MHGNARATDQGFVDERTLLIGQVAPALLRALLPRVRRALARELKRLRGEFVFAVVIRVQH